jgi:hypothetical protein
LPSDKSLNDPHRLQVVRDSVHRAWSRVLGLESLRQNEAFDVSGGDSLAFLRLIHHIEEDLDQAVDLGRVSLAHTPDALIEAIGAGLAAPTGGADPRPRIFFVPVAGGAGPGQAAFRAGCARDFDVVIMDLPSWTRLVEPGFRFGDLVDFLVDRIVAEVPSGPILLAGYCFGGAIACVVAQDLTARGRTVGLLAMLDGDIEWFRREPRDGQFGLFGLEQLKTIRWSWQQGRLSEYLARVTSETLTTHFPRVLRGLAKSAVFGRLPRDYGFYLNLHLLLKLLPKFDREELNRRMRRPTPLPIPFGIFRTYDHPGRPDDLGWSELFQPTTAIAFQTGHEQFFAPVVINQLCADFTAWAQATLRGTNAPHQAKAVPDLAAS